MHIHIPTYIYFTENESLLESRISSSVDLIFFGYFNIHVVI